MAQETTRGMRVRQVKPLTQPHARINTDMPGADAMDPHADKNGSALSAVNDAMPAKPKGVPESIHRLMTFASTSGNLCPMLDPGQVAAVGHSALMEWSEDAGTHEPWKEQAQDALNEAAQDDPDAPAEGTGKSTPWEDASNIKYPILAKATLDWNARAYPELVKGDQLVKAKVFAPTNDGVSPGEIAKDGPKPQTPQDQMAAAKTMQQGDQAAAQLADAKRERQARADRVAKFINHVIFYQMDGWETDTDLMFAQLPAAGQGFKKVYMGVDGVRSDFVSAIDLVVDNDRTKTLRRCPRVTHEFEKYPYEIEEMQLAGRWNDVDLPYVGNDPQAPRKLVEQMRNEDLDQDGVTEPYLVTIDVETRQVLCIEAAYTLDDVTIDEASDVPRVVKFNRWRSYADFKFLVDPRGKFYGMGFGKLLASITDAVDSSINQMMDANHAVIAGGGFIGSGVRLTGSGQGGILYFQPGQYQTVSLPGGDIRQAIYEKTTPNLSPATFQLLELLLSAAKDLAAVKDVLSGEGPQNAPVGTTLAIQQQAMQTFSAIFKRVYRGFREEASMIYECLRRWRRPQDVQLYEELTGGNWDNDFAADDKDLELVADPNVISRLMKISRVQALTQTAESEVGKAAGMLESGPAQELVREALDAMDVDRPERFLAKPQPNPELMAKVAQTQADAARASAGAALDRQKADKLESDANLDRAKALRELALATNEAHGVNAAADAAVGSDTMQEAQAPDGQTEPTQPNPGQAPSGGTAPSPA